MSDDHRTATALYTLSSLDAIDYLAAVRDPSTSTGALRMLREMLKNPTGDKANRGMNELLLLPVELELERRGK